MARREYDQLLGHAEENDGIEEFDNPMPDWWVGMFLLTIVWAAVYAIEYHVVSDRSQVGAYEAELADAAVRWPVKEAVVSVAPADIEEGRTIYAANCVGCHGPDLTGTVIAPNLVDADWIHGGSPEEVMATITKGVPEKGMVTWGPILGPDRISKVAAFILSQREPAKPDEGG